jgi:hypothetical protein
MSYTLDIGSVSSGTLLTEDLLDSFSWEVERIAKTGDADAAQLLRDISKWQDGENEGGDVNDEGSELVADCIDLLNEYCPPYCYFGTHPGDGADFGCWPIEIEEIREQGVVDVSDPSELDDLAPEETEALFVNDHGNVTLYARSANGWREVWSIV